jgi:hypothetical protein
MSMDGTDIAAPKTMIEACRVFCKDTVTPMADCVKNHFGGDIDNFIAVHSSSGKLIHSKFKLICNGKGVSCSCTAK